MKKVLTFLVILVSMSSCGLYTSAQLSQMSYELRKYNHDSKMLMMEHNANIYRIYNPPNERYYHRDH